MSKKTLHFIGIGGVGVSAVARVLHQQGDYIVRGSDVRESQLTLGLRKLGIDVTIGHNAENVRGADAVVYSTAVPVNNIERQAARDLGIAEKHRADMLGACMEKQRSIGVTGTHGKGTVSAMIAHTLISAGRDPTFVIGGILQNYKENARAGKGPEAVAEVDESDRSHLKLKPKIVVVNNIEVDHLNFYAGLDDIITTMAQFIDQNDQLEALCLNLDDAGCRSLKEKLTPTSRYRIVSYGRDAARDFSAQQIEDLGDCVKLHCVENGVDKGVISLPICGSYNAENAMGAMAVCCGVLGLPFSDFQTALNNYKGLENRFTVLHAGGLTIVKDYISHPTGMRKVLESAHKLPHKKIYCVFKPYRFTLMRYHGEEYATALRLADSLVITEMYAAEEKAIDGIDTPWFVDVLRRAGNTVDYVKENSEVLTALEPKLEAGDMVVFFGGDDFFQMADRWAKALNEKGE